MDGVMVVSAHDAYFFYKVCSGVFYTPNTEITGTEGGQALCAISINQLLRYLVSKLTQVQFIFITYIA